MKKSRLEAFSDGVFAIIITIMVLEIKVPHHDDFKALLPLIPVFLSYILSFIYLGIYWNNHHHLMHTVKNVTGGILWANLHLLFWLSLIPFATGWMGENSFTREPLVIYGVILLLSAIAYFILQQTIIRSHGTDSELKKAVGRDLKGKLSPLFYLLGITFAWINTWISCSFYVLVAFVWLIPDKRIERISEKDSED